MDKRLLFIASIAIAALFSSHLFFDCFWPALLVIPCVPMLLKWRKHHIRKQLQENTILQFKEFLSSFSLAVTSGKSADNAIRDAYADLTLVYSSTSAPFMQCLRNIIEQTESGVVMESSMVRAFASFEVAEMNDFANLFGKVKRRSGNLPEFIARFHAQISEMLDTQAEIEVMVAKKKLESKLMFMIPLIVLALMKWSSPDYLLPLYETSIGFILMCCFIVICSFCFFWTQRIMRLDV